MVLQTMWVKWFMQFCGPCSHITAKTTWCMTAWPKTAKIDNITRQFYAVWLSRLQGSCSFVQLQFCVVHAVYAGFIQNRTCLLLLLLLGDLAEWTPSELESLLMPIFLSREKHWEICWGEVTHQGWGKKSNKRKILSKSIMASIGHYNLLGKFPRMRQLGWPAS